MWVKYLPADYQRRFYTNLAIVIALVVFVTNVWRLGPKNGSIAVLALIGLLFAYGMLYPCIRILRAKPRPDRIAFVLVGMNLAAFVYLALSFVIPHLPGSLLVLFAAVVSMWTLMVRYRSLVFPSLFDSRGGLGTYRERKAVIRQARTAAELDRQQR